MSTSAVDKRATPSQVAINALGNEVQALFQKETGRKLGFSKAKELAAKLMGLRNSNVCGQADQVGRPEAVTTAGTPERFVILPSCDGPQYDIHLGFPGDISQSALEGTMDRLHKLFSLWYHVDDLPEQYSDALCGLMCGERDLHEYLKLHGRAAFGVRYVEPSERFAWDNPNQLNKITVENFDKVLGLLKGDLATESPQGPGAITAGIEEVEISCSIEGSGGPFGETVRASLYKNGRLVCVCDGGTWRAFESEIRSLDRLLLIACKAGVETEFIEIVTDEELDAERKVVLVKAFLSKTTGLFDFR